MYRDILSGGAILALSVGYYVTAMGFPTSALDTSVSSSAFPELIGILGACFAALLVVQGLWRVSMRRPALKIDGDGLYDWGTHKAACGLLIIAALFLVALDTLGYPAALACMIFAVVTYQGIPVGWKSVSASLAGAAICWLLFVQILGIHMPLGFWQR